MFRKPFRVKSQSTMKGSDRKRLREEFRLQYLGVIDSQLTLIFGSNEDVTAMKINTHGGQDAFVYFLQKNPAFFELDKIIYPTVYLLWRYPDLIPALTTYPDVFKKLEGGADLMLPGVVISDDGSSTSGLGVFSKDQGCAIKLCGNRAAVAVGRTAMSSAEMIEARMRGKGVVVLHTYRDLLWALGDKSELPLLVATPSLMNSARDSTSAVDGNMQDCAVESELSELATNTVSSAEDSREAGITSPDIVSSDTECGNVADAANHSDSVAETNAAVELDTEDGAAASSSNYGAGADSTTNGADVGSDSKECRDVLLYQCFMCALKTTARKVELPLLTSSFFRNHMVPCCPTGASLDVKKSSYKKLSKFLAAMQQRGFVQVKELSKGVESIVSIDRDHSELRSFEMPDWSVDSAAVDSVPEAADSAFSYTAPTISEMYQVTSAVLPLMNEKRKGDTMTVQELRQQVTQYVQSNELQDSNNKSMVKLNAVLHDALVARGGYVEAVRWDELFTRCLAKMTPVHCVTFTGAETQIHRGRLEPIELDVVQRGSNKKATVVYNLATYGIDPEYFASTVQKGIACSVTVGPRPAKPKEIQVMVQGNQINYIGQLLRDKYKLPQKYIRGLEKAPKMPKRKT